MNDTTPDRERGLYDKYHVERKEDPTGKHRDCNYFVLDLKHDKFAAAALRAYAWACASEYPDLARDICLIVNGPLEPPEMMGLRD